MSRNFTLTFVLLTVVQMILSNFFHFTPYISLSLLPVMVLNIPTKTDTVAAMLIAFVTGLAVDLFAEGTLGINALSLVPIALIRRPLIGLMFGSEPFEQNESITTGKYGTVRVFVELLLGNLIFFAIYVSAECAGTRPLWFIAARTGLSAVCSAFISLFTVNLLAYDSRR